uniref:Sodium channel modifier 1 zinc-finger domain-containing protein n=1 Tax=Chrysemys picta bellii TaxID=8478 RepID=A0A8C3FNP3_CHRPI
MTVFPLSLRYACTVCFHRPVFDTLDMLTVHRAGKKHIASLQTFYGKKRSRENEVQKRRQQEFLRAEEAGTQDLACPAPLLAQTRKIAQNALLKASPYNSCCRRNRTEPAAPTAFGSAVGKQPAEPGSSVARGEEGCAAADTPPSTRLPGHASPRAGTSLRGSGVLPLPLRHLGTIKSTIRLSHCSSSYVSAIFRKFQCCCLLLRVGGLEGKTPGFLSQGVIRVGDGAGSQDSLGSSSSSERGVGSSG